VHIQVATPAGYEPNTGVVAEAKTLGRRYGTRVSVGVDPKAAVRGAHAVATDTWISMGDEQETASRRTAFAGFTIDEALMSRALPGAKFMHCLPGHWGEEATYEVAHGPRSLIFDEAENRMWVQMAILVHVLRGPPLQAAA